MDKFFDSDDPGDYLDNPYLGLAKQLYKLLFKARRTKQIKNLATWAQELRRITTQDGHSEIDIQKTIGWLEKEVLKRYTPKVFSAESFRRKFVQIRNACEASLEIHGEKDVNLEAVTQSLLLHPELQNWSYDNVSVHNYIYSSYRDFSAFWLFLQTEFTDKRLQNFATHVFNHGCGCTKVGFFAQWLIATKKNIDSRPSHPSLGFEKWALDHPQFERIMKTIAWRWNSSVELFFAMQQEYATYEN